MFDGEQCLLDQATVLWDMGMLQKLGSRVKSLPKKEGILLRKEEKEY